MADIQLARAYVEIIPVTKGISKKTHDAVFPGTDVADTAAKKSGNAFSSRLGSVLKKTALGVGVAAGGLLSASLVKGFGRLSAIENAEAKLSGLGNSASSVSSIMDNALASVKGTAFGMDEAATTAASAVAAGIKPGKELESYLRLVGDAATIAGTDMSDMGSIFNKVATSGKVQGDVFAQLGDKGIPIVALLSEKMGVSAEEVYKLGAAGKISSDDFLEAMSSMSGAALEGGNTTSGAFKNMGAAMSRFGAELLSGVFPLIGPFFGAITAAIDQATSAIGPAIEKITPTLQAVAGSALATVTTVIESIGGIGEVIRTGDFNPANWADGVQEDSALVGAAFAIRDAWVQVRDVMGPILGSIRDGIAAAIPHVKALWGWFTELSIGAKAVFGGSLIVGGLAAFGKLGATFGLVAGKVKALAGPLARFAPLLRFMVGPVGLIVGGLATLIVTNDEVRASFGGLLEVLGDVIGTTMTTLAPVVAELAVALGPVLGAAAVAVGQALQALAPVVVWVVDAVASLLKWMQPALPIIVGVAGGVFALVKVFAVLAPIVMKVVGIVTKVIGVVSKIGPLITALTGPIGWIVIGVTAAGVALWAFFTKTEKGRALWAQIWGGIKAAVAVVVDWVMGTAWPAMQAAWDGIAAGALWLYNNAILPAWAGIKTAIEVVGNWITGTLWPAIQTAWSAIGAAAMWLWQNVMMPAWQGIKTVIAVVVTAVLVYIDLLKWYFSNVIAPVALWLYNNVMVPVWNGIKAVIGAVANWIIGTAWPLIKRAWDAIAGAAMWLWNNALKPAWAGIQAAISAVVSWLIATAWPLLQRVIGWIGRAFGALKLTLELYWKAIKWAISTVVAWFRDTAWPILKSVIEAIKAGFALMRDSLKAAWRFVKNNVINPVVTWFRDTAWPALKSVVESIKSAFNTMRDSLKAAWRYVRHDVIAPVAAWFRDTIKPLFDRVTGGVSDAFDTLKKAVEKSWQQIRDTAKEPIRFVIEDIIRDGIVSKYNTVAETFGVGTIDEKKFTVGWARGGILPGFTPIHRGDDVLTPMRSGEGVLVSEGLRDRESRRAFLGANAAAKRGMSFADYVGGGYAGGGLVKLRMPFAGSYPRGDGFGARGGRHKGIDWPMPAGAILKAVAAGHVRHTRNAAAGNKLELQIGNGLVAGYHHLSSYIAKNGSSVGRGADVARVGSTGRSSGPHLHFSLKRDGSYVDPLPYLGGGGEAGEGGGGGWNPFAGLWDSLKEKVRKGVGSAPLGDMLYEVPKKLIGGAVDWAGRKLAEIGDWGMEKVEGAANTLRAARWTPLAAQALRMEGEYSRGNLSSLLRRMEQESGFNPRAINDWDSNARRGTPSKGLMQVIGPTFRAYARPGYDKDIWDPLSNILASIRYARAAYGSPARGWDRRGGYSEGGVVAGLYDRGGWLPPGGVGVNLSSRPEPVFTGAQWDLLADGLAERRDQDERPLYAFGDVHGVTVEDIVDEMEKRERKRGALRVPVRA